MPIDRRRHRMFVTRNTEYHLHGDQCVGVRDRRTGLWLLDHVALRLRALRLPARGHDHHWIGKRIQFWSSRADVTTSPVEGVGRPETSSPDSYIMRSAVGEILAA